MQPIARPGTRGLQMRVADGVPGAGTVDTFAARCGKRRDHHGFPTSSRDARAVDVPAHPRHPVIGSHRPGIERRSDQRAGCQPRCGLIGSHRSMSDSTTRISTAPRVVSRQMMSSDQPRA